MSLPRPLRTAEIIAVGTELLGWTRLDTNSLFIAERLASIGIQLRAKTVVRDDRLDLAARFRDALGRVDLVIVTGGLGPTDDDLTRDVVAEVLGLSLTSDPAIVAHIQRRFARRGLRMPEANQRQALVPDGATVLENASGTAPGLLIEHGEHVIVLLPGPPRELQAIFTPLIDGVLAKRASSERLFRRLLFVTGRSESHVEEAVRPLYEAWRTAAPPIEVTILASPGQIELHLTVRSADPDQASRCLSAAVADASAILGQDVFSTDGRAMEEIVGELLHAHGYTIAVAESCSGGLLLSRLTDVPGSSAWVLAGVVVYSNESKIRFADVPAALLAAHGAVSEPVAVALAEGIRGRVGAHIGVGVTGIAGPGGGTERKPVGMVVIAVAGPDATARVRTFSFPGGRSQVKKHASQAALDMVRRTLERK